MNDIIIKQKFLIYVIFLEILLTIFVSVASFSSEIGFVLFYNLFYGLICSVVIPVLVLHKNKESFKSVGIKKLGKRQYVVMFSFILFSVGGQLVPLSIKNTPIRFDLIPICFFPLLMTTFFEEFLFRGFIQTRLEKQYGYIFAILVSGLFFSLYHIGYSGFRNIQDLTLLFAVGFAVAYKLSGNNLIVSYFVNLPNAFVTYMLKSSQFPPLTILSSVFAIITIMLIILIFIFINRLKYKSNEN